jgi:hypothetical protein
MTRFWMSLLAWAKNNNVLAIILALVLVKLTIAAVVICAFTIF